MGEMGKFGGNRRKFINFVEIIRNMQYTLTLGGGRQWLFIISELCQTKYERTFRSVRYVGEQLGD